jgi:hypothetical protein
MIRSILLAALALGLSPLTLAQGDIDCRAIAAATVAELRAGYEGWSDEAEQLARAAAGAGCVKATMASRSVTSTQGLSSTVVSADGVGGTGAVEGEVEVEGEGEAEKGEVSEKDDDSSWNPLSGIKFNKVSARPNKKPYERRRQSLDEE